MTGRPSHSRLRQVLRPRTRLKALLAEWRATDPNFAARVQAGWPADFTAWVGRTQGRQAAPYPERWRARTDLPIAEPSRVAVLAHVFYPELATELFERAAALPVDFDLLVTNASGLPVELPENLGRCRNVRVLEVDNHGRDILPLVNVVNAGLLDPYWLVCKVHTKRSAWRAGHDLDGDGDGWRRLLLDALLGSGTGELLAAFVADPELGMVTADGSVLGPEQWGDNDAHVANLLRRLELKLDRRSLRFAAGSMYWARGFVLQGLRALNLGSADFEQEAGQVNATTAHAVERLLGVVAAEAGLRVEERSAVAAGDLALLGDLDPAAAWSPRARVVPFYLPQFHPVPENDRWWGAGFTEWTNVTSARPVFLGHAQPRLPGDLGFYDLRLDDVRRAQRDLAAGMGLSGFMYYHYWFAGQRLLDRPIEQLVASDIEQPFCLMWANENWTRRWDGREDDVLLAQDYEHVPTAKLIEDLLPFLADRRYLSVGGRKVVAIYRPGQIPDLPGVLDEWRRRAREAGVGELCILDVEVGHEFDGVDVASGRQGLDGSLGFPPHNHEYVWLPHAAYSVDARFTGNLLSYVGMANAAIEALRGGVARDRYPGVMVTFDNTPRRQWSSDVWYGTNPFTFRRWLAAAVAAVADRPLDERLVFANAWNEWAEGAVLEPTDRYGRTFLLAVRDVLAG